MKWRRILGFGVVICLQGLNACSAGNHAGESGNRVTLSVNGLEKQIYSPVKLAEALGYFKDEGLDVELLNSRSGAQAANDLLAGNVQGTVGFYDHTIDLQTKGKAVQAIVLLTLSPGEVELVSRDAPQSVKSLYDLKGGSFGVTGLGSSTEFLTRFLATKANLRPTDYSILSVGAGDTFASALKQHQISAGMTTEPTASGLVQSGAARVLVDLRNPDTTRAVLGGSYPSAALYVDSNWLARHPAVAQKLANAFVRTLSWLATHSPAQIAEKLPRDYYAGSKELYVHGLEEQRAMFSTDGAMPADGPATVLSVLRASNPDMKDKPVDLSKTFTNSFVVRAKGASR